MKDRIKNIGLILAIVIAGISLPTSIVSFMDKPTSPITEIHNYYHNTTIIEQTNNTGMHIIHPITYLPAQDSGATLEGNWINLDAIDEYMYATFFANSDVVDTSKDVIFRFIMNCVQTDASLQMLKYGAHTRTDNTEILSWNIDFDVAISFNMTTQVMFIYEYIFDATDVEDNDWLSFALKLNETARTVGIEYAEVEYIHI